MERDRHPLETDALAELRTDQRRLLRYVESWLFLDALQGIDMVFNDRWMSEREIRLIIEAELRDRAQRVLDDDRQLGEFLARMRRGLGAGETIERLLKPHAPMNDALKATVDDFFERADDRVQGFARTADDRPLQKRLNELIVLLTWADIVADDGYLDERVRYQIGQLVGTSAQ